jgi:hypothetical protein
MASTAQLEELQQQHKELQQLSDSKSQQIAELREAVQRKVIKKKWYKPIWNRKRLYTYA